MGGKPNNLSAGCAERIIMDKYEALLPYLIMGAENDDDQGDPDDDKDAVDEDKDTDAKGEDVTGLKNALSAERARIKIANAELKELRKLKDKVDADELAQKSLVEQATEKLAKSEKRSERLAAGLLRERTNNALRIAAQEANFVDIDDALAGVDRSKLGIEQDPKDPSNITLDKKVILNAVKELGKTKPHYLKQGTDDGTPTGSPFGGSGGKKQKNTQDELKLRYPGL